jgi:hypothetical protein
MPRGIAPAFAPGGERAGAYRLEAGGATTLATVGRVRISGGRLVAG